ncbi:hypothetical protein PIB30_071790 [Stylosanthes scabra]|uniref:C2H2-type domain-containing protein n=1 Tax=Stylosanthes scabra TaxID=79078 RepID=A0ABU6VM93_9FABA|nr:hypothetical protein [Stylosanthes scabra]
MEFYNNLEDYSKSSSSEETDRSSYEQNDQDMGTGRSYECVFCKRGFTTAQALGGHMNIHRKDRANNKGKIPPSSSSKVDDESYYADLGHYSSPIPSYLARNGDYHHHEVDNNNNNNPYHQFYFPPSHTNSHVQYNEILFIENQRENGKLFGQDWRQRGNNNLSLYTNNNPICVHENNSDKIKDKGEDGGLDLELRLGHYP